MIKFNLIVSLLILPIMATDIAAQARFTPCLLYTSLLRDEDVDNLRIDVAERRYRRGEAIKLMQLRDRIEFEKVRTAGEGQVAVEQMRQGLELQELTLAHRKREDEYSDERRARERELQRADRQSEIELDNAERCV